MSELIHVHIGALDGDFHVRRLITTGPFAGCYEIQQDADTIGWVHQRWCSPVDVKRPAATLQSAPIVKNTDWRKFLHDHWLQERNMLNPDFAEEFMRIFMAAFSSWKANQQSRADEPNTPNPTGSTDDTKLAITSTPSSKAEKPAKLYPDEVVKTAHGTWIQLSLF